MVRISIKYLIFALVLITLTIPFLNARENKSTKPAHAGNSEIAWLSFEEAIQKNSEKPKKIFIDVYTNWCGWCKVMDKQTFTDPLIIKYINDKYYAVKLNAERKDTVVFGNKEYTFVPLGKRGYHELAKELLNGKMSYPSIVFLDEQTSRIQSIPGFRRAPELDVILKYFGGNHYRTTDYQTFSNNYVSPYSKE